MTYCTLANEERGASMERCRGAAIFQVIAATARSLTGRKAMSIELFQDFICHDLVDRQIGGIALQRGERIESCCSLTQADIRYG